MPAPSRWSIPCCLKLRHCAPDTPPVDISVLMDRSISIRQAVSDVEETLLIAVALVILVIFLFLRSASGIHPRACRSDLVVRHLRRHVRAGLLDQQHDAVGAPRRSDSWSTMPS
jgi:hypothetical protein